MSERIDGMDIIPLEEYFSTDGAREESEKKHALPSAPEFPLDALPRPMRDLAKKAADSISCPIDYVATTALATAAGRIGSTRVARVKQGWEEPPILYIAQVGPSGDGKTPAQKEATLPITNQQRKLYAQHKNDLKEYEEECRNYEVEKAQARKEGTAPGEPPIKPYLSSLFVQDTTPEGLVKVL